MQGVLSVSDQEIRIIFLLHSSQQDLVKQLGLLYCHYGIISEHTQSQKNLTCQPPNEIMTRKNELTLNMRPRLGKQKPLDIPSKTCFTERYYMFLRSFKPCVGYQAKETCKHIYRKLLKKCVKEEGRIKKNQHGKLRILIFPHIQHVEGPGGNPLEQQSLGKASPHPP